MTEDNKKSFLGTGWSFPPRFLDSEQGIEMSRDDDDIAESLHILLSTVPGERLMNPEYGCDLQSQVFQNINNSTKVIIEDLIATAILYFEPRIRLIGVNVDDAGQMSGIVNVSITYEVKGVNSRRNMVYPFYLAEGTDL
jgi:phage baseplate assembly protein W